MSTVTKNGITLTYVGTEGTSSVSATGVTNEGLDQSVDFTISAGTESKTVTVNQEGRREVFNDDFILKDGEKFCVIKSGYK